MKTVTEFEGLLIWQDAKKLTKDIYKYFGKLKDYGFRDQIQRASVSVMNNIAEGFERSSDKEFIYFLNVAKASAGEVRSQLYLAFDLEYLEENDFNELKNNALEVSKMISGFIKYLKK